jgi:hypothetical protein
MTASFNGLATNIQLGRLVNVSDTWTITPNTIVHGQAQTVISFIATGLPYHGYGNVDEKKNVPKIQDYNRSWIYRGGLNVASANAQDVTSGPIGFWLNGVAIYSPSAQDAFPQGFIRPSGFNFNASYQSGLNLGYSFNEDLAGGKADADKVYNYREYSFVNAWNTGLGGKPYSYTVHGLADVAVIPYLNGGLQFSDGHSKILGFSLDGYPVYGPYGYSNPTDNTSTVRSMRSGYTLKISSYRIGTSANDTTKYPMGMFVQDYEFTNAGDLDIHNGRYCVTPDFPNGTYAYFCSVDTARKPTYPYVIGKTWYGEVDLLTLEQALQSNSSYPVWVTPAGNLGKIQALQFFELGVQAVDPTGQPDGKDVNYTLIAGKLPSGLQLDATGQVTGNPKATYSIDGVPSAVTQDRVSNFTVRATSAGMKITDRSFTITVTGNYPPQLLTSNFYPLGKFLDGAPISIQLSAVDLNNDTLVFSITNGNLPKGISLSSSGLISGNIIPNNDGSSSATYNFTVSVSDGKSLDTKNYQIVTYNHADLRADNDGITDDNYTLTIDSTVDRTPILLTVDFGDRATVYSNNYFAFKFNGIDYDGINVGYQSIGLNNTGWDADLWDNGIWDQGSLALPSFLSLDQYTGWLTGFIPPQAVVSQSYTFAIQVYSLNDSTIVSPPLIFTLTVLGALNLNVTWNTPSDLGSIDGGSISQLYINATASSATKLYYSLANGSKLPQGLTLLNDGNISGRVSFQAFALDKGSTRFDEDNAAKLIYSAPTTFDRTYNFTVTAQDFANNSITGQVSTIVSTTTASNVITTNSTTGIAAGQLVYAPGIPSGTFVSSFITDTSITLSAAATSTNTNVGALFGTGNVTYGSYISGQQAFKLRLNTVTYSSYDNLYLSCSPEISKRTLLSTILGNTDYFNPNDVYRANDPWWGIQSSIKVLVGYGLTPAQSSAYIAAMQYRHFAKKFYFGDYNYAVALDSNGNPLYDVVYVDIIEDTKINNTTSIVPAASFTSVSGQVGYTNDLNLMINDIVVAVGETNTNVLPQWQTSVQPDGKTIGFKTVAILAYMKPGNGEKALFNLQSRSPSDIKLVPFSVDRYVLDNNLDAFFNTASGAFLSKKNTSFDTGYIQSQSITFNVDFAIDLPFSAIDTNTPQNIVALGGLDGDTNFSSWNGKYLIFSTQEYYNPLLFPNLTAPVWGWIQNNLVIPGFIDVQNNTSSVNQRAGIWQIILRNGIVTLSFVRQILLNQIVGVNFGLKAGTTQQYSTADINTNNQTVPKYKTVNINTIQLKSSTTFDKNSTKFISNEDQYFVPFTNDSYLKFPRTNVFQ